MIEKIKNWFRWILTIKWEFFLVAGCVLFFFLLPDWLRTADSTSAPLDPGVLSAPVVGIIAVVVALFLFWIIVRIIAPVIDRWFDGTRPKDSDETYISFERDWLRVGPAVRLSVFFGLLVAVLLAVAIGTLAALM